MPAPFFVYHMPRFTFPSAPAEGIFDQLGTLVTAAEDAGFDLVTVMDHFYQIPGVGAETEPMLEAYVTLGALAARTRTVRLGTLVTGVTYRNPALLAKMVTTLDVISGGRAVLGIGAAWNEDEHLGYGFPFPPIRERMDRLDEALRIATSMFRDERPSFEGRFYRIERALNVPRPVQPGGPRILIGGSGERRTLRLVARYADMSNWFGSLDDLKRKDEVLRRHCEAEGRDPNAILRTIMAPVWLVRDRDRVRQMLDRVPPERRAIIGEPATVEEAAERLRPYLEAGFRGFTFRNPNLATPELIGAAGQLKKLLS